MFVGLRLAARQAEAKRCPSKLDGRTPVASLAYRSLLSAVSKGVACRRDGSYPLLGTTVDHPCCPKASVTLLGRPQSGRASADERSEQNMRIALLERWRTGNHGIRLGATTEHARAMYDQKQGEGKLGIDTEEQGTGESAVCKAMRTGVDAYED